MGFFADWISKALCFCKGLIRGYFYCRGERLGLGGGIKSMGIVFLQSRICKVLHLCFDLL